MFTSPPSIGLLLGLALAVAAPYAAAQAIAAPGGLPVAIDLSMPPGGAPQAPTPPLVRSLTATGTAGRLPAPACSDAGCALPDGPINELPYGVHSFDLAINPTRPANLVVSATDTRCRSNMGVHSSTDSGGHWRHHCLDAMESHRGYGNTATAFDSTGRAYVAGVHSPNNGTTAVIGVATSTDQGRSWSRPTLAVDNILDGVADKPSIAADLHPASPFRDSVYIVNTQWSTGGYSTLSVSHSRNGGQSWTTVKTQKVRSLNENWPQYSQLAIARDGTVHLAYLECENWRGPWDLCGGNRVNLMVQRSSDGGLSWSRPDPAMRVRLPPNPCMRYYGCLPEWGGWIMSATLPISTMPKIAVDNSDGPHSGTLYLVAHDWEMKFDEQGYATGFMAVKLTASTDGGITWRPKAQFAGGRSLADQWYPTVNVSPSGTLGVTWLDRRADRKWQHSYHAYARTSTDGGQTWGERVQLSSAPSDIYHDGAEPKSGWSMGSSNSAAFANETLYLAFLDVRTGFLQGYLGGLAP